MIGRRARIIALWGMSVVAGLVIVVNAHYVNDLSAFLPETPTPIQRTLIDQLRDGPASRLILIGLEGGDAGARASLSTTMAHRLRISEAFASVQNGEPTAADRDREFLFGHRYLLSDAVTAQHFSTDGLQTAIGDTIDELASSSGLMLKSLLPHDPTGETLKILDRLAQRGGPRTQNGVWVSADGERALLVAQTAASGSDTDAQSRAIDAIRLAFGAPAPNIHLKISGPGVFAVAARAKIKRAATRLSVVSSVLVMTVLLAVYRSIPVLLLGLLPVASGALMGVAAVALGFGAVHGITLGFGITLIGESVDYSIYFFIARSGWQRNVWPTLRLGMMTSVCGFASLLPSSFPGLAQLGVYSISGLLTAALVTRFVLPEVLPRHVAIRDLSPLGVHIDRLRYSIRRFGDFKIASAGFAIAAAASLLLIRHHDTFWNRELASLSPVSLEDQRYDATLRADLGAADVLDLVIVSGPTQESVLRGAENAAPTLQGLINAHVIGDFETPAIYLPSMATQRLRRDALPEKATLQQELRQATAGLNLKDNQLSPFVEDVETARRTPLLGMEDLRGTSFAAGFGALMLHRPGYWNALLPLHAPTKQGAAEPKIDVARVTKALAAAHLNDTQTLDFKGQTDALYASYLRQALGLSLAGFGIIAILLLVAIRSPVRVLRILSPLILAVLTVAAGLRLCGQQMTLLHLVGMLLIVAVGSNYALFFDHEGTLQHDQTFSRTLASLTIANLCTVIGFGLLSFSQVPVLVALGVTVGPGAFLALLYSALMTSRLAPTVAHA